MLCPHRCPLLRSPRPTAVAFSRADCPQCFPTVTDSTVGSTSGFMVTGKRAEASPGSKHSVCFLDRDGWGLRAETTVSGHLTRPRGLLTPLHPAGKCIRRLLGPAGPAWPIWPRNQGDVRGSWPWAPAHVPDPASDTKELPRGEHSNVGLGSSADQDGHHGDSSVFLSSAAGRVQMCAAPVRPRGEPEPQALSLSHLPCGDAEALRSETTFLRWFGHQGTGAGSATAPHGSGVRADRKRRGKTRVGRADEAAVGILKLE